MKNNKVAQKLFLLSEPHSICGQIHLELFQDTVALKCYHTQISLQLTSYA